MQGQFFNQVFQNGKPRQLRQVEAMYKQIGIDISVDDLENMTERDLEDRIVIKAILDYNSAKFASEDQCAIDGIVRDVFNDKLKDWKISNDIKEMQKSNSERQDYGSLKQLICDAFEFENFDHCLALELKCYQLYEITMVK